MSTELAAVDGGGDHVISDPVERATGRCAHEHRAHSANIVEKLNETEPFRDGIDGSSETIGERLATDGRSVPFELCRMAGTHDCDQPLRTAEQIVGICHFMKPRTRPASVSPNPRDMSNPSRSASDLMLGLHSPRNPLNPRPSQSHSRNRSHGLSGRRRGRHGQCGPRDAEHSERAGVSRR